MAEERRKCVKCGCSPAKDGVKLFRFPKPGVTNLIRCTLWAKYILPDKEYASITIQKKLHNEHRMLCQKHFADSDFTDESKTKLVRTAVPFDKQATHIQIQPGPSQTTSTSVERTPFKDRTNITAEPEPTRTAAPAVTMEVGSSKTLIPTKRTSKNRAYLLSKEVGIDSKQEILYNKCQKYMKKICYLQNRIKGLTRKEILNILDKDSSVIKLSKKITPTLALLLQGHLRNCNKKQTGRRWTKEEKIVALRIFKRSPTCYRLLRRLFCLPSPGTLKSTLNKVPFSVGLNKPLFRVLKKFVASQKDNENLYILMFDEMSIKKHFHYNLKQDIIEGFQDHGSHGRSPIAASYALVFMIAGITKKIKQPIAHYFSSGFSSADRLAVLIKEVLNECFLAGINIIGTVCDMDGVNRRAYATLGASQDQPFFKFMDKEILTFFDTPHLIKCFRNLFLKYDIECSTDISSDDKIGKGIAKWSYIKEFYDLDNGNPNFVYAPALTKDHLNPNTRQKMKVSMACQVLSHSVAGGMYAKISKGELPLEAITTANLIQEMDKLFDCLNSDCSDLRRGKAYSTNLSATSPHLSLFVKMKSFFKNMKYTGITRTPPSQEGWIWTISSMERLWNILQKVFKIKHLATRRIQQDALENLFGCIRGNCGANTNPTSGQFVAALKTAILSKLAHIVSGNNCEKDDNVVISNFEAFLSIPPSTRPTQSTEYELSNEEEFVPDLQESLESDSPEIQACAYVCGFIIKKIGSTCENCKKCLLSTTVEKHHIFVECREYEDFKRSLNYATESMVGCVEKCASLINMLLNEKGHCDNLKEVITTELKKSVNFDFLDSCKEHKTLTIYKIIHHVFSICVKRFCIVKNRAFAHEASSAALKRKIDILTHK